MGSLCAKNAIEKFSRLGTFNKRISKEERTYLLSFELLLADIGKASTSHTAKRQNKIVLGWRDKVTSGDSLAP